MRPMRREHCGYWQRRGTCKFGDQSVTTEPPNRRLTRSSSSRCRYLHDGQHSERGARLHRFTDHGMSLRQGSRVCNIFARTGTCPYGSQCKYDHMARLLDGGNKAAPMNGMGRPHSQFPQKHRRMRSHDMRRFNTKSLYQDPGQMGSSKGWRSTGSETSPQPCTDTSPRSTNDANGTFQQSCSPQSTQPTSHTSPLPHVEASMTCFGDNGGYISQEGVHGGHHHLANLFHRTLEQSGTSFTTHLYQLEYVSWPRIPSQWYGAGIPNEVMLTRLDRERDIKILKTPTVPSHLLKPFRDQEGAFLQY